MFWGQFDKWKRPRYGNGGKRRERGETGKRGHWEVDWEYLALFRFNKWHPPSATHFCSSFCSLLIVHPASRLVGF